MFTPEHQIVWGSERVDGRIWSQTQVLCLQGHLSSLLANSFSDRSHEIIAHNPTPEGLLSQESKEYTRLKKSLCQDMFALPHEKKKNLTFF